MELYISIQKDGKTEEIPADNVLLSIGRRASTKDIGLESLGVLTERGAIVTDRFMKTNIPNVYAVGDVNGHSMLAHTAYREAEVAVNNILGKKDIMRYNAIPAVIYTNPEVGSVGETEETAKAKGMDVENKEGAGAAGGLGAALCGFLKANLKSGIETVLDLIDFDGLLEGTDLVVTGEGRIDWQSAFGKVPSGIGMRCKAKGVPAVAIVGGMGNGAEKIYDFGVESIIPTINGAMDIEEALERAEELYANAADRTFRMIRVGMQMN